MIAIKEITKNDELLFEEFLKTERKSLPKLKLAHLAHPHKDIFVSNFDVKLKTNEWKYHKTQTECFTVVSQEIPFTIDNGLFLFSGYCFYNSEMFIGANEAISGVGSIDNMSDLYGEYCTCYIYNKSICLKSDFFGMEPWFYYYKDGRFAASNNYHLLLILTSSAIKGVKLDIRRSRVNILTSGFTYGTPFSKKLDVENFYLLFAAEYLIFDQQKGLQLKKNSLSEILDSHEEWDDNLYKEYIYKAKKEIYECCLAACKSHHFEKIVVDVSGGFDSRVVFATITNMPDQYKYKIFTHTRKSGTSDDIEKAAALTNIYNYKKHSYEKVDDTRLYINDRNEINLDHISRTLGTYSVSSYLYTSNYTDFKTLELTGYLGEVVLGYKRCRGELNYSLGDRRLLRRIGGCYLHNEVTHLAEVFNDQEQLINETLGLYANCDCLFKKNQRLYIDTRNRFICNSSHNIENNNLRIPMLFSKYALKAKWMYFNLFTNNKVPPEKVSIDLIDSINIVLGAFPFAENNNEVMPKSETLLNHSKIRVNPDYTVYDAPRTNNRKNLFCDQVLKFMDDLDIAEQMLLQIYDYSQDFKNICLGLYTVLQKFKANTKDFRTSHGRETIRKIYDIYFQMSTISQH